MPDAKPDAPPPIDRDEALERVGGDGAFLDELLALYDAEYAEKAAALAEAIEAGDAERVRALGHGLKGASANLSLPGLRQASLEMETAGRAGDFAAARAAWRRWAQAYAARTACRA